MKNKNYDYNYYLHFLYILQLAYIGLTCFINTFNYKQK